MAQVIDMNDRTSPKPPPKAKPKPAAKAKPAAEPITADKKRTPADKKLGAELASAYQGIGLAVIGIGISREDNGVRDTGVSMVNHAEQAAEAWLDLADQNPAVKRALKKFTEASAIGSLVVVHLSMAAPLLADRGVIPAPLAAMANASPGVPE